MKSNHSGTGVLDISPLGTDVSLIDFAPENSCRNVGYIPHRPGLIIMDNGRVKTSYGRSNLYSATTNHSYGNWFCRGNEYAKTPLRADMMAFINNNNKDIYNHAKYGGGMGETSLNSDYNLPNDNHSFISNFAQNSGRTPIKGILSSGTFPPSTASFRHTNYKQQFATPHHKYVEERQCSSPNMPKTPQTPLCLPATFSKKKLQIQSDFDPSNHSFHKRDIPTRSKHLSFAKEMSGNCLPNVEYGNDSVQRRKINQSATIAQQKLHHLRQQQSPAQESPVNGCNTTSHHIADLIHASANLQSTIDKTKALTQSNILNCQQLQIQPQSQAEVHLDGSKMGNRCGVITNAPLIPRRNGKPINAFLVQPPRKNIYDTRSPSSCSSPSSEHLRNQYQLSARQNTSRMQYPELREFRQHLEGNVTSNSPQEISNKCEESFTPTNPDIADTSKLQTSCSTNTPKRSILKNSTSNSRYCDNPCNWGNQSTNRRQSFSDMSFFRYQNHPNMNHSRFPPANSVSDASSRMCAGDPYRNFYNNQFQLPAERQFLQDGKNISEQKCPSKASLNRKKVSFLL